jgi:excisionase family DNA binding protein
MENSEKNSLLLGQALLGAIRQAVHEEIKGVLGRNDKRATQDKDGRKEYFTPKEAADYARIAPSTIRLYVRKRQLRALHVGRRVVIKRADLVRFLDSHPIETVDNE